MVKSPSNFLAENIHMSADIYADRKFKIDRILFNYYRSRVRFDTEVKID